jgi:hypothetical protein
MRVHMILILGAFVLILMGALTNDILAYSEKDFGVRTECKFLHQSSQLTNPPFQTCQSQFLVFN